MPAKALTRASCRRRSHPADPFGAGGGCTVYYADGQVQLEKTVHRQTTFLWFRFDADASVRCEGVRITFGASGFPAILEPIGAPGPPRVFVTESVAQAARDQFGTPAAGATHAVEHGADVQPRFEVADVIGDGQAPMGPFVYLAGGPGPVSMHCRCSPSEVATVVATNEYVMKPLDALPEPARAHLPEMAPAEAPWLGLRLPDAF